MGRAVLPKARRERWALLLMLLSGFAGLSYQIVWTQQSALWLGHESAAVLAVVGAFFGGLALGAWVLGQRMERSARPALWYAACEAVLGLWSLALVFLMEPASAALLTWTGPQPDPIWQWLVACGGTGVLLLPATAAMGATLPAMERALTPLCASSGGRSLAALYAANTGGAVLGVMVCAWLLVPRWGLAFTASLCAAINFSAAGLAWFALGRNPGDPARVIPAAEPGVDSAPNSAPDSIPDAPIRTLARRRVLALLALTGCLGIGYEVLVVRVLSQVTEDTVYTFSLLLAVYLIGSAVGAAAWHRWVARRGLAEQLQRAGGDGSLLMALAAACLLGTLSLWGAESFKLAFLSLAGTTFGNGLGTGLGAALGAEAGLALLAFGLPTLVMGAVFSQLCARASQLGLGFGQALAVNTAGAALAPLLWGVLLAPAVGPKAALLAVVLGYLGLAWMAQPRPPRSHWRLSTALALVLGLAVFAPPLAFVDVPEGGRIVHYQDGAMGAVSVVEDAEGVLRLRINNRQQEGSSVTRLVDGRQALLPLLLHPAPRQALFLGLGTGVTAKTATLDPQLSVEAVELLPEVVTASYRFRPVGGDAAAETQRLHIRVADARRFVRTTPGRYDLIVSDNFQPARSGSGALYTVEHFQAVRARLAPAGVFCQWLPLHQLDLDTLRSIVRSFLLAFPQGGAMLASNSLETPVLGLVGRQDDGGFDADALTQRLQQAQARWTESPRQFGLDDSFAVLGSFVAGPGNLRQFAADAPANTDDHPVVAYAAPRITYVPDSRPRDRLLSLLETWAQAPADWAQLLSPTSNPQEVAALVAYTQAKRLFLEAGRDVAPSPDARRMLAQVQQPLLEALHQSPHFRPAYLPLVHLASALAPRDPAAARALLTELAALPTGWPEAADALERLPGAGR